MIKYFGFTWDEILWGRSWVNILMLLATIPNFDTKKEPDEDVEVDGIADIARLLEGD